MNKRFVEMYHVVSQSVPAGEALRTNVAPKLREDAAFVLQVAVQGLFPLVLPDASGTGEKL